jgi:CRP/FNR family cyclic AMP-dependent transcriptional regulator
MTRTLNHSPSREDDLDKISNFRSLSWLSASELRVLAKFLKCDEFESSDVILREGAFATRAYILLRGVARVTCQTARTDRVTIAFVAPGLIPQVSSLVPSRFDFRCESYNDCRVGSLAWSDFNAIAPRGAESALNAFHQNNLRQWYRILSRSSDFLAADLHERIALAMLELAADFGITDSRGTLLKEPFSHDDIAELVGASRPRTTEHLARLEREGLLSREGRRFIVRENPRSARGIE